MPSLSLVSLAATVKEQIDEFEEKGPSGMEEGRVSLVRATLEDVDKVAPLFSPRCLWLTFGS